MLKVGKGRCLEAGLEQAFEHALYRKLSKPTQLFSDLAHAKLPL